MTEPTTVRAVTPMSLKAISYNVNSILTGKMISIDPSSGSRESLPGWAVFEGGKLKKSGVIEIDPNLMGPQYLPHRLQAIGKYCRNYLTDCDLLAIEKITEPNSGTIMSAYMPLLKSVGAFESNILFKYHIGIPPWDWKTHVPTGYIKSDMNDAESIGNFLVHHATAAKKKAKAIIAKAKLAQKAEKGKIDA